MQPHEPSTFFSIVTETLQPLAGFLALLLLAWLAGERRPVNWRTVGGGIALQWLFGALLLGLPLFRDALAALTGVLNELQQATAAGTGFVFGYLGGGPLPFEESRPGASFILAFRALPLVLVISALSALLYRWRVLPWVVKGFAAVLRRIMGIGGAEGVGTAANVFVGMVEAPLLVRPYLERVDRGALFAIMACGMATVAGTMMVLYAGVLGPVLGDAMGHILTASLISAPAALTVAALMVPAERGVDEAVEMVPDSSTGSMDAITRGTVDGLRLYLNIIAMLLVLVALVSLANRLVGLLPWPGDEALTIQRLVGYLFAPLVWLAGVPWSEALTAGSLMGTKTVLNEFIAYLDLAAMEPGVLSERSRLIMVYALCGFANFGSLGIMIGGLTTLAPGRREEIVGLGLRSIVAGSLATTLTGAVVAILHG